MKTQINKIAAMLFIFSLLLGCNPKEEQFKIGAILPLTGNASYLGTQEKKGIDLAAGEYSDSEITVLYEDSKNQNKESINAFNKLYSFEAVDAAIITHSGVCGPISDYIKSNPQDDYPLCIGTVVASTKITQDNDVFFRLYPSGAQEAKPMAEYVFNMAGTQKVGVYYQNDDYGLDGLENFKKRFSELGGSVIWTEAFSKDIRDHKSVISKFLSEKLDAIYVIGNTPAFAMSIKQLRELKYDGSIYSGSSIMVPNFNEIIGDAMNGIVFSSTVFDVPRSEFTEEANAFVDSYVSKFDEQPDFLGAFSYSSFVVIMEAMKFAEENNMELKDALKDMDPIKTPVGLIQFNDLNEANIPIAIQKWETLDSISLIKIVN